MTRAFSFGGGVQSVAALVLAARKKIFFDVFMFANVGEDSEEEKTLAYLRETAIPYARANGISLVEVSRSGETLYQRTIREERSIGIPVRMENGAPGHRQCTTLYKRAVVRKALGKGDHIVGLGISWDEIERMATDSGYRNISNEYPLIDLRMTREDCEKLIASEGIPVPPKSACWFCPFHRLNHWRDLRQKSPETFKKAAELERMLIDKSVSLGRRPVYLTRKGRPLEEAVDPQMIILFGDDESSCESGYCMT